MRRSKGVVIRSTYPPAAEHDGAVAGAAGSATRSAASPGRDPFEHRLRFALADGTRVEADVVFLALDGPDAEEKLRGLEVTWAWVNEAREIPKPVFSFLLGRVGRYPADARRRADLVGRVLRHQQHGTATTGCTSCSRRSGPRAGACSGSPAACCGTASPGCRTRRPRTWRNLPAGYYQRQLAGQSHDWIRIYLANEPGFVIDGRPVYPEFFDSLHVAAEPLAPVPYAPVVIGLDFGLTPAAVFCQRTARGRWLVLAELVAEDMGVTRFAELLAAHIAAWFPGVECRAWGDPAGSSALADRRADLPGDRARRWPRSAALRGADQQLHAAARGRGRRRSGG